MQHPFLSLKSEYDQLLASMVITRPRAVEKAARDVIKNVASHYASVSQWTGVPAALIGVLNMRESNQNFRTGLGQGDPIDQVSRHVPRGHGPFASWEDAARFYIHYDHLDDNTSPWGYAYTCWKSEIWNGFGYRAHGVHSPYLWAGSNHQQPGKYVSDGNWDARAVDNQLGAIVVMVRMIELEPNLGFGDAVLKIESPPIVPRVPPAGIASARLVQHLLNERGADPQLIEDGNYGRRTREAVRAFQHANGLTPDGLAGPLTLAKLQEHVVPAA